MDDRKKPGDGDGQRAEPLQPPPIKPIKGMQTVVLDALGIDGLCGLIVEGHSLTRIAQHVSVGKTTLLGWIAADPDRSARVREARRLSSESYADMAEDVLMQATTPVEVSRARELAQHYRWKASKMDPGQYGDKVQLDGSLNLNELDDEQLASRIARLAAAAGLSGLVGTGVTGAAAAISGGQAAAAAAPGGAGAP